MEVMDINSSKLIWSDGIISSYTFDADLGSFTLYFTDYQRLSWEVKFINVVSHFIYDPVYISDAKFTLFNGLNIAEIYDDDGVIIKVVYEQSEAMCL